MLKFIHIKNFQSIKGADIELGRLTVLAGPGRSGKSAVIRALRSALFNSGVDGFIRHGEKYMKVELGFEELGYNNDGAIGSYPTSKEGVVVHWTKERGAGGVYMLEAGQGTEQTFSKTRGAVPEEIEAITQVREMEIDNLTRLTPQLHNQTDPAFIVSETGSKQARVLGVLTHLDSIVTAQMTCRKAGEEHRRGEEAMAVQVESLQVELDALPDIDGLASKLDAVKEKLSIVRQAQHVIDDGEVAKRRLLKAQQMPDPSRAEELVTTARPRLAPLEGAVHVIEKLEAARRAQGHDPTSLEEKLVGVPDLLDCVQGQTVAVARYNVTAETHSILEAALDVAVTQHAELARRYQEACAEAGVCQVCGGLLDHKECDV